MLEAYIGLLMGFLSAKYDTGVTEAEVSDVRAIHENSSAGSSHSSAATMK
jgi:hypothetical protein